MKLASVKIMSFRNFLDSTEFQIQPDVTCLVGKNESGNVGTAGIVANEPSCFNAV